ncbi:MAG: 1-deoxy-D-xylulose-5-phosphate synthase [Bacilli bacterium]|nr:1-deoxy-D-xylulose-5-phosphate synthase [Bacilli bacterium]
MAGAKEEPKGLSFENPSFLRSMRKDELVVLAADIRRELIRVCSEYGGHLSSNLGDVELTLALHRVFDFSHDKLIFDVGHQCYTHKILTGRSLEHLNQRGQVAGFQKMAESSYDPWEAGHSSTSISAAQAYAIARDEKGENYDVVALIGDSSIVNGLALEALNSVGSGPNKVIVVLNDNDMSISQPSGGLSRFFRSISTGRAYNKLKKGYKEITFKTAFGRKIYEWSLSVKNWFKRKLVPLNMFDNMGFSYIGPIDGHNIKSMEKAFKRAKETNKSVVLHIRTIKGKGYVYAERDQTGYWHGVTPFVIATGQPKDLHPGKVSWSHFFADLTNELMGTHPNTHLIVPATGKGSGLEKAFAAYPKRCHDVGIAEEHAATLCGGLSVTGIHPILSIYSTFMQRCYDEISHDCARMKANMTILVDRAGLVGSNGDTHQGIYDVAYLKSIPNVVVAMPSTKSIGRALFEQSFENHGVFAIRYPREMVDDTSESFSQNLPFLRWRYEAASSSKKLAIVAVGPREKEILEAVKKRFLDVEVIDPVYLCPLLSDNLLPLLSFKNILIYDAYGIREGFAETVLAGLAELGYKGKITVRAVPRTFVAQAKLNEQLEEFGLLPEQILREIADLLAR